MIASPLLTQAFAGDFCLFLLVLAEKRQNQMVNPDGLLFLLRFTGLHPLLELFPTKMDNDANQQKGDEGSQ